MIFNSHSVVWRMVAGARTVYELRGCVTASLCNLLCCALVVLCSVVVARYSIGYSIRTSLLNDTSGRGLRSRCVFLVTDARSDG